MIACGVGLLQRGFQHHAKGFWTRPKEGEERFSQELTGCNFVPERNPAWVRFSHVSSTRQTGRVNISCLWRGSYFSPSSFPLSLCTKWSRVQAGQITPSYSSVLGIDVLSDTQT